jgi:hypothetical protein
MLVLYSPRQPWARPLHRFSKNGVKTMQTVQKTMQKRCKNDAKTV